MLTRLQAHGFRNLGPLDWAPGPGSHLLVGDNGAGKSSLLEAIYILATTRSFRASRLGVCAHHDQDSFHLFGEVERQRRWRLAVAWERAAGLTRSVDASATSLAEHLAVLPVVAWTAAEGEVVTGEPSLRRRFLDRGVVGARLAGLDVLSRYRQALDRKRELLSAISSDGSSSRSAGASLAPWNDLLAEAAAAVIEHRARYAESLARAFEEVLAQAGARIPEIRLRYLPSPKRGREGREAIREVLERVQDRERAAGFALVGPQRDELEILWGGHPVRAVASAGESKLLSLLLLAAHGRILEDSGRMPVYLLDDLDAELSPAALGRVWRCFAEGGQVLATSNRPAVWKGLEVGKTHSLVEGVLRER